MKNIVTLGASSSSTSINKTLAVYAASKLKDASITVIDLKNYELPLYSVDSEEEFGIPEGALQFNKIIESADGLIISLAEHNGTYTAVFKNLIDWLSRIDIKVWKDLPILLMSTSPGKQGGGSVMEAAKQGFPFLGGHIVTDFSLPSFYDNFSNDRIINTELATKLNEKIAAFEEVMESVVAV